MHLRLRKFVKRLRFDSVSLFFFSSVSFDLPVVLIFSVMLQAVNLKTSEILNHETTQVICVSNVKISSIFFLDLFSLVPTLFRSSFPFGFLFTRSATRVVKMHWLRFWRY